MKNYFRLGMLLLAITLYSCGGNETPAEGGNSTETINPNSVSSDNASVAEESGELPPSEQVHLDNKGVGPITNVVLSDEIDQDLAEEGEELYNQHCTACHKPYERFIGPAQEGALERRSPEWIMNMIINPDKMLQEDPLAMALLEEFKSPMTNQGITEDEARALLEYIRSL